MSTTPTQGILLIATSHPFYGRMAVNLANTIKAVNPDIPISILTDDIGLNHLNDREKSLFYSIIQVEVERGLIGINRLRMYLPRYSPFKETLAMDADTLWLPKARVSDAFSLLNGRDFTIVNEGYYDLDKMKDHGTRPYTHWAEPEEIKEAYGLTGKLWKVRGEFVLFRKGAVITKLFKTARDIQKAPKVDVAKLGGAVTDEFALNVAMNICGIDPHQAGWQPTYWPHMHGGQIPQVYNLHGYYAVSFGGNDLVRNAAKLYATLCGNAAYKTGVRYRFMIHPKREFLKERIEN